MPAPGSRAEQRAATHERLLSAALDVLRANGVGQLSTLAVQKAAGASRGAMLHHFPTRGDLLREVIGRIVDANEAAVEAALARTADGDVVERAVRALLTAAQSDSAMVEMEMWLAARTNPELRADLVTAERAAGRDLERVLSRAFGPDLAAHPSFPLVSAMTLALVRGLSIGQVLRRSTASTDAAIRQWSALARDMLHTTTQGATP
ncbi:TetR/AcrR family transcriptional regulator [Cumulibacter manganitolerans]|uniref:TetR/AcrR family transcriptional regulator n=1 Tax=Cumulibacter manganitolerans TaxID=1884992 RepID=UPI0012952ADC|nr:TetR/AcrR family transcriptional regulator [Cumulibacter manganitolerans]